MAKAFATRNMEAKTVATLLLNNFVTHYGLPEKILTDQAQDFEGRVIKQLCLLLGVDKVRTTPYHPQGNGITERFNRTILSMLRSLEGSRKLDWKSQLPLLTLAYNCTKHSSTGYSPYRIMFGRQPRLPIDLLYGLDVDGPASETHDDFVAECKSNLEKAWKEASKQLLKSADHMKRYYNSKVRGSDPEVGDHVLVKTVRWDGTHKIQDRFDQDIYVVVSKSDDVPVYTVRTLDGSKERTLHRNLLLPIGLQEEVVKDEEIQAANPIDDEVTDNPIDDDNEDDEDSEDTDDTDEDEVVRRYPRRDTRQPQRYGR